MSARSKDRRRGKQAAASRSARAADASPAEAPAARPAGSWLTLLLAGLSSLMLWAALPPLAWWTLAWIAPLPWLWLVQMPRMPGRWPHRALFLAAFCHWLAVLQGIRLAHPALYGGWVALSFYLAFYPLLFVVLTRVAVHRARTPLMIAAPAVWTGLELARGYVITGFSAALLGHTQYRQTWLIQISDLLGAYGVSFVVMLTAAALASGLPWRRWLPPPLGSRSEALAGASPLAEDRWRPLPLAAAALVLAATLAYGGFRLQEHRAAVAARQSEPPPLRVVLLQENVETIFDYDRERSIDTFRRYMRLARRAVDEHKELDLIIWPESAFNALQPVVIFADDAVPPEGLEWSAEEFAFQKEQAVRPAQLKAQGAAVQLGESAAMLVGTDVFYYGRQPQRFNSAALYSPEGELVERYDKVHRVMFGEYIPFGEQIPLLYRITPMQSGLTSGAKAEAFEWNGVRLAPNICFESTVPHLIRRHVRELARRGETPDVLVNLTNDGWFKGSSILDLHLICGVFRAVENRRPLLVAANIGISAEIDAAGRLVQQAPRREVTVIPAAVYASDASLSHYTVWGDWPAGLCLLFTLTMAALPLAARFRRRK